jgi:hypothetical protein
MVGSSEMEELDNQIKELKEKKSRLLSKRDKEAFAEKEYIAFCKLAHNYLINRDNSENFMIEMYNSFLKSAPCELENFEIVEIINAELNNLNEKIKNTKELINYFNSLKKVFDKKGVSK